MKVPTFNAVRRDGQIDHGGPAKGAKAAIRREVLEGVGGGKRAHVFDAYAGSGAMHTAVWHEAATYVGCDQKWFRDGRVMFVADNRRVLRTLDLGRFNVFDLDAYGSPWEQAVIIAARRPVERGERVGMAITDGSGITVKTGEPLPHALRELTGILGMHGMIRWQDEIIDRALAGLCRRMGCELKARWEARGRTGALVRYMGLVFEGASPESLRAGS
jgi:hypothetical protein